MSMLDKESIQSIRNVLKEQLKLQNEYIDSKLIAMEYQIKKDILEDITKLHFDIIEDIIKLDKK